MNVKILKSYINYCTNVAGVVPTINGLKEYKRINEGE